MNTTVNDLAYRVYKIRANSATVWCKPVSGVPVVVTGRVCAIQVVYKHETTQAIVRGSLSGNTAEANCTVREMVLFPHELVETVLIRTEKGIRILTIDTNFSRHLHVQVDAAEDCKFGFSRSEFRAVNFDGSQFKNLTVVPKIGGNGSTVFPPTTTSARFRTITKMFTGKYERLIRLEPARIVDLVQAFVSTTHQVYVIHGYVSILEAHQLVNSTRISAECLKLADRHDSDWWGLTISNSFFATRKVGVVPNFEAIAAQLMREAKELYVQDAALFFNLAWEQSDQLAAIAIVHSLIDNDEIDVAARLCLQAATAFGCTEQISELIYEIRRILVADRVVNHQSTHNEASSAVVLAIESSGYTALHAAAARHFFFVVELFLLYAQIDPSTQEPNDSKRPIDLVGDLSDQEAQSEDVKRILFLLDRCTKAREFQLRTTAVLGAKSVTREAVDGLLSNMTEVKDLQLILALGVSNLDTVAFKQLTIQAFQYIISNKLVFDDDAAVYFQMGLKQCFEKGYISETELEFWRLQTSKVNMESALWVSELKETICNMQTQITTLETNAQLLKQHLEHLRQTLISKELQEQRKARIRRVLSVVSLGMASLCGPLLNDSVDGFVDFADPVHMLSACTDVKESDIIKFCTETAPKLVINAGLEATLTRAGIEPLELASVLKDAVIFEHPEYVKRSNVPTESFASEVQVIDLPPSQSVGLRVSSLSLEDNQRAYSLTQEYSEADGPSVQDFERQQLAAFPYHLAVLQCGGDFEEFLELLEIADEETHDVNNVCEVIVPLKASSTFEKMTLAPYAFASYLGYVDIVKHLRVRPDFKTATVHEPMIKTLSRARKIFKATQAV